MSARKDPLLMVCVMCGRDQFERPGDWITLTSSSQLGAIRLCEADAPNFDPARSYDPIRAERWSSVTTCRECGHRRFVMETGQEHFICADCGADAPPLLVTPTARRADG
jgi:ribosomal protein L37E